MFPPHASSPPDPPTTERSPLSRSLDIRLTHLVPPLDDTCDESVQQALGHPDLFEEHWWRQARLPLALHTVGPDHLAAGLAHLTLERWEDLAPGEVMPALYLTDEHPDVLGTPPREWSDAEGSHKYLHDLYLTVLERLPHQAPPSGPGTGPLFTEIERWFATADPRRRAVAGRRVLTLHLETLDSLGSRFGVTRERIRQIHKQVGQEVRARLDSAQGARVAAHLLDLSRDLGAATPLDAFWDLSPEYPDVLPSLDLRVGDVLLALLPDHRVVDGWVTSEASTTLVERLTEELAHRIVIPLEEAELVPLDGGVPAEHVRAWLSALPHARVMDDHLLRWGRNLPDKAFAVLTTVGRPLHFDELVERVGGGFNESGFRERIHGDARIMRRDRRLFGLRAWGGREYVGLEETMRRQLAEAGGEMPVGTLVERITDWFDITESSIRAMAAGSEFTRPSPGRVALPGTVSAQTDYRPRRTAERTRRCFRDPDGLWWLRVDLNNEHLRGSGFPIPSGFAVKLGMSPGCRLPVYIGDRASIAAWKNQPLMNSIRPLLLVEDAQVGDHAFITLTKGRVLCRFHKANAVPEDPLAGALYLAGRSDSDGRAALVHAVGLPEDAGPARLMAHLTDRGDQDLLTLLTPHL